jgi:hypothetical protein
MLSQQGKEHTLSLTFTTRSPNLNIVVIDDNAKPMGSKQIDRSAMTPQRHRSLPPVSSNRWGLSKQDYSDSLVDDSSSTLESSSRHRHPVERRAPRKTKSDESLVIPQRLASPSMLHAARKRIRSQPRKLLDDSSKSITLLSATDLSSTATTSRSSQAIPPLSLRFQSPMVQQDAFRKTISTNPTSSSSSSSSSATSPKNAFSVRIPESRTTASTSSSVESSLSILEEVQAILDLQEGKLVLSKTSRLEPINTATLPTRPVSKEVATIARKVD